MKETFLQTTPLIEFRNVTKGFGDKSVLDNVNLKIYENQQHLLLNLGM